MMTETKVEIVRRLYRSLVAGDRDGLLKLLHPSFIGEVRGLPNGLPGLLEDPQSMLALWERMERLFTVQPEPHEFLETRDGGLVVFGRHTGTAVPTGKRLEAAFTDVLEFAEERIVALRQVTDSQRWKDALLPTGAAPLANVITLGARQLSVLRDFYRDLKWRLILDREDYAALELRGIVLALFPVEKLAADGRARPDFGRGGVRFTIGIIAENAGVVDELAERVRRAGGRVTKEPVDAEYFVGRSAYFTDPEENYWEIAWAPPDNPIVAAAHRAAGHG